MRLVLAGWGLTILLAVLIIVADPRQIGFAIMVAIVAGAMGAWVWRRGSRPALVISLVLGLLVLLAFGSYTVENATGEGFDAIVFITDAIGVIGGLTIVVGAALGLLRRRRGNEAAV